MSIFDVRRYVSYLNCSFVPHPVKFTAFISKSVEKNKSISSKHGGFKVLPQEKDCLNKNIFFVIVVGQYHTIIFVLVVGQLSSEVFKKAF